MSKALVVLDARSTRQMSVGMKTYVRELSARLPAMAPDLGFLVVSNEALKTEADCIRISDAAASNFSLGEQLLLPMLLHTRAWGAGGRKRRVLAHYMSVYAPRWSPLPYVYTIHDLIHRRFPQYFSWKVPLYYAFWAGPVARGARAIITDAQATVADLTDHLQVRREKIRVVTLGVAEHFFVPEESRERQAGAARTKFGLDLPFFLYAGNHREHKNLKTLAQAWSEIEVPCDLVMTEDGPFSFAVDRYSKPGGAIRRLGKVSQLDLVGLYAACIAVVQPSLYEGFGLSVLEAMAVGTPVVVAQTPALLEVAGEAALSFPPTDDRMLGVCLRHLLESPELRLRLRAAGEKQVREFTWDETARRSAAVYREFL